MCSNASFSAIPKPSFATVTSTDTSLTVHIDGQGCQRNEGKVLQYLIYYGEQDCEKGTVIIVFVLSYASAPFY